MAIKILDFKSPQPQLFIEGVQVFDCYNDILILIFEFAS